MGLLSFFSSGKDRNPDRESLPPINLTVDLGTFKIGATSIGAPLSNSDPYFLILSEDEIFKPIGQGFELGSEEELLDYGFFALASFAGSFTHHGLALDLGNLTGENHIIEVFGEPYWIDRSDGEVIMFYEYQSGAIELQFELSDDEKIAFVTLSRNGVLSDPAQRESYGVNKPWPPQ